MATYSEIAAALITEGKANVQSLWQQVKDNFEAHQSRLNSLEAVSAFVPTGTVVWYGNDTVPFGYLACTGAVVSQATYPSLYAAIGSSFNTGGEGSGNFRLPNISGRTAVGSGTGAALSTRTVGQSLGAETHTLTESELAGHNHSVAEGGHTHYWQNHSAYTTDGSNSKAVQTGLGATELYTTVTNLNATLTSTGGSAAHNNMQPSLCVGFIIKY